MSEDTDDTIEYAMDNEPAEAPPVPAPRPAASHEDRVSDGIMRQLLLWVHHNNNSIILLTYNDIQLKFTIFLHKNTIRT